MDNNFLTTIITYIQEHWASFAFKAILSITISIIGYIIIKWIVNKIRTRIEANSLEEDIYSKKTS